MQGDSPYQLLPDLTEDEFAALKADIAARGVMVPIERDETGAVLDGHHRIRACEELGITNYPTIIRTGMTEDEKRDHVLALNLDRRHLTGDQRKELTAKLRALGMSLRAIAEAEGVTQTTVARDLAGVTNVTPDAEPPAKVTGADGKQYPATRPKPTAVITSTPRQTQAALDILQTIGTEPPKALSTVADLKQAARYDGAARREAEAKEQGEGFTSTALLTLHHGRFQDVAATIEAGSVDLIFTDPPYGKEHLPLWSDLSDVAARVLKPGGILLAFVGKTHMLPCMNALAEHLGYYWTCSVGYEGARKTVWGVRFWGQWRPIVVFANGEPPDHRYAYDMLHLEKERRPDQSLHPWAQADDAATYYVERLTEPGGTVLDPMCGTGTFVRAAAGLNRRAIGIEADKDRFGVCAGLCCDG